MESSKRIPRLSFWSNKYKIAASTLLIAAKNNRIDIVNLLLSYGANADKKDLMNAFLEILPTGNHEAIRLMVNAGANVNVKDYQYMTPLMYAIIFPAPDQKLTIECLLSAGAFVNAQCHPYILSGKERRVEVNTPLTYATKYCSQDIIEILKSKKRK